MTSQLSVENAMAKRAAENSEKMDAKHSVTALQNAILLLYRSLGCCVYYIFCSKEE